MKGEFFMIITYDFGIGLVEYEERGKENEFPIFDRCPSCNCIPSGNLHRNGFYWRYGIEEQFELLIPICRMRCLACGVNISILPDFLIPYFQHTLHMIVERVRRFLSEEKVNGCRQQLAQHVKRYYESLPWIHSFFMDLGHPLGFSKNLKKEALKYMKMILDTGISPFFRKSWGHLSSYFMGTLILPYLSTE